MQWSQTLQQSLRSKHVQDMACYGGLTLMQKGAGFFMLPFTTRYLSLEQYGLLESLMVILVFCSLLEISAGALPKMFADCQQQSCPDESQKTLLSSALRLSIGYGFVLFLLISLALKHAPLAVFEMLEKRQIMMVSITVWMMVVLQPLQIWLRIQQRARSYCVLVATQTVLQIGISFWGLSQGWGMDAILIASLVSHSISVILGAAMTHQHWRAKIDTSIMKRTVQYQVCLISASLALFVMHGLDRLLLGNWLGHEALARYGVMIKMVEVVAVVFGVMETWWLPKRYQVLAQPEGARKVVQVHQAMLLVLLCLLLGASVFSPSVLRYLLPPEYHLALQWLPLMLTALGFKLATSIFDIGCYLPNRPVWLGRINLICAFSALVLYYLLIPKWGVWGLIVASNLVYFSRFMAFAYISQRTRSLPYRVKKLIWMSVPVLMCLMACSALNSQVFSHFISAVTLMLLCVLAVQFYKCQTSHQPNRNAIRTS